MSYEKILSKAKVIQTSGEIVVPADYSGEKNFIIPDQIVNFCASEYSLANSRTHVIDPMCGIGTIPRIINNLGGNCLGIEIDEERYNVALSTQNKSQLLNGDYLEIDLPTNNYNCIFTSMPFNWFRDSGQAVNPDYAARFKQLLTQDGTVLLDSVPTVKRTGKEWDVAFRQCEYLEKNGFLLVEITRFKNDDNEDITDESVIMLFKQTIYDKSISV